MISYGLIRLFTTPFRYLPYRLIHALGRRLGSVAFYCIRSYRKRALSNLALAKGLRIQSEKELIQIAKESFQNLAINALEYARFDRETDFSRVIQCENPEIGEALHRQGVGIIFFCGHQSNWEALFLDGTRRMRGIAIGKSIKNKKLYRWIVSIREKFGGKIVSQNDALKEGLRALRKGAFLGIVGDQGMPSSNYAFPFMGRMARTSTAPALLAYRTHSPLIVATTRRVPGGYRIRYSDPIWPDPSQPAECEIKRLMDHSLSVLEKSIRASPGEWLWQHNRWKKQTPQTVYKRYRHDSLCVALPDDESILPHLPTLRRIYPEEFLFLFAPLRFREILPNLNADEIFYYQDQRELFRRDYRFKLLFNFTPYPLESYYRKLSVFETLTILPPFDSLSEHLLKTLCRRPL